MNTAFDKKKLKRGLDDMLPKEIVSAVDEVSSTTREIVLEEVNGRVISITFTDEKSTKTSLKKQSAMIGSLVISNLVGIVAGVKIATEHPELARIVGEVIDSILQTL